LGARVRRREDPRLITGAGTYLDDLPPAGRCHLVFERSYLPHANIEAIDLAAARSAPGVIAVVTAIDMKGAPTFPVSGPKGSRLPERPLLNGDRVRFSGDLIGFIIAETREQARDAADLIAVELDARPVVTDPLAAVRVIAPEVGGGFGAKLSVYPEELLVPWAAMRLARPVKWVEDRSEHLQATTHGRDQIHDAELAVSADGSLRGLKVRLTADLGAY